VFGIFCREQARAVSRRHDVVVLASDAVRAPDFGLFQLSDGVEDGLRTLRLRYRRPLFRPAAMACQVAGMVVAVRRLRRDGWRAEIIHAHVYSAGLPALLLGLISRAPVVISEHYTGFQRGLIRGYDRFTARLAFRYAGVVAPVSENLAAHVRALAPRARVRVVENVVDTEVFHPPQGRDRPGGDGSARLLTVAALAAKKGHADLLEALAEVRRERNATLDLVGEGELRAELQDRVGRLGLDEAVRFHGELSKEQVAAHMREADLFVLASRFENLPCVLIEAMASGLPSVATEVGAVPDLLDGVGGVVCPPGDPRALATAISSAIERRGQIDAGALADRARERFGYEAIERRWSEIYEELTGPSRPQPGSEPYKADNLLDRLTRRSTLEVHYSHITRREQLLVRSRLGISSGEALSVGCGWNPGRHLFPAPAFRLLAVDADPERVEGVLSSGRADEAKVGYAGELDLPADSFDVVLYRLVLHHLAFQGPLRSCFVEAARVLRPGGALVAIEPGLWHPVGLGLALANRLGLGPLVHGTPDDVPLSPRRLCAEARAAGLVPELHAVTYTWRRLPPALQRALQPLDAIGSWPGAAQLGHTLMLIARVPT
jgi:glycosyltransferase involved in cell wall biosynthesis/SAM-dependent methyltransferase